jgi:hypothetical protein
MVVLTAAACGGPSPETRVTETAIARDGTRPPDGVDAARTAVAAAPEASIPAEAATVLAAEATLPIASPTPSVDSAIRAVGDVMREEAAPPGTPGP